MRNSLKFSALLALSAVAGAPDEALARPTTHKPAKPPTLMESYIEQFKLRAQYAKDKAGLETANGKISTDLNDCGWQRGSLSGEKEQLKHDLGEQSKRATKAEKANEGVEARNESLLEQRKILLALLGAALTAALVAGFFVRRKNIRDKETIETRDGALHAALELYHKVKNFGHAAVNEHLQGQFNDLNGITETVVRQVEALTDLKFDRNPADPKAALQTALETLRKVVGTALGKGKMIIEPQKIIERYLNEAQEILFFINKGNYHTGDLELKEKLFFEELNAELTQVRTLVNIDQADSGMDRACVLLWRVQELRKQIIGTAKKEMPAK